MDTQVCNAQFKKYDIIHILASYNPFFYGSLSLLRVTAFPNCVFNGLLLFFIFLNLLLSVPLWGFR